MTVDIITPAYNEKPEAVEATLLACLRQSYPISTIFLIDDGSESAVSIPASCSSAPIQLIRLPKNQGISVARNLALQKCESEFIACVNVEVLPELDWLETCIAYLKRHPQVGACFTKTFPKEQKDVLCQWRVRFHELKYEQESGVADFAIGHAVLFRAAAIKAVNGYQAKYRRTREDSDICYRMRARGWETHYVASSYCLSIQEDSLISLARKQLIRTGYEIDREFSMQQLFFDTTKSLFNRLARNTLKGRLNFIPIDILVYLYGMYFAVAKKRTMRSKA